MAERRTRVQVFVDPACGWCHVAVDWLEAVATARPLDIDLQPYSLLLRDGTDGLNPMRLQRRTASLRALRLLAASPTSERLVVWRQILAQDGPEPFADIDAPDDDGPVREVMAAIDARLDGELALPLLVIDDGLPFSGPLLDDVPDGDDALALFDALVRLVATPGFFGLSRPRPGAPARIRARMAAPH